MRMREVLVWTAILCSSCVLNGQQAGAGSVGGASAGASYTPHLTFDVASIRESRSGNWSYYDNAPKASYFHGERIPALGLILNAYDVKLFSRIQNAPGWTLTTKYDVTAKSDAAADEELAKLSDADFRAEKKHMLKVLLADRFKLKVHSEVRQATVYELVATERTAKLMTPIHGDVARTVSTCGYHYSPKGIEIKAEGCPLHILLSDLSQTLDGDVVDRTGLSGAYAFDLMWGPSLLSEREGRDYYPQIRDAIRDQLGLEIKLTKGPATFWVVDHIEHPTEN